MIMIFKAINLKFKLQENLRKKMVLSLMINVAIAINLGIGKIVALNIKEGLEMTEMIGDEEDIAPIQALLLLVIAISNTYIKSEKKRKTEEDHLLHKVTHQALQVLVHLPRGK
jgi:hypothetical protein